MRLGKRQMSSKYPNAIALGVARHWLDTAPMAHQNLPERTRICKQYPQLRTESTGQS